MDLGVDLGVARGWIEDGSSRFAQTKNANVPSSVVLWDTYFGILSEQKTPSHSRGLGTQQTEPKNQQISANIKLSFIRLLWSQQLLQFHQRVQELQPLQLRL